MSKIATQLTELIGNTPLLELNKYSELKGTLATVIAKIEYFNPGGSVKDRIALAMIECNHLPICLSLYGRRLP